MRRAIVVFIENKRYLLSQFGCLYYSYRYIDAKDTDLIVFGSEDTLKLVPDDCIKVEYYPISYSQGWKNYHFINSISCLTEGSSEFLAEYDMLLRTDADTFLTPAWNSFYPEFYTVGQGAYVNDNETKNNIKKVSNIFGLKHKGIHNIGSTHYGNSALVREVCKLALRVSKHILNVEFKDKDGNWPGWFSGVSSMYGSEIAVNHLVDTVRVDATKLDYDSTSNDLILNHPHIHCWHTESPFSKFYFEKGKYDNISFKSLDIRIVRDYCLYIALKSKRELKHLNH